MGARKYYMGSYTVPALIDVDQLVRMMFGPQTAAATARPAYTPRLQWRCAPQWPRKNMAVVTRRFVEKQAARLLRQTPCLSKLRWRVHSLADAPLNAVCALIQDAWQRVYGNRIRIAFTPALLRYAAACSDGPGVVTIAEDDEGLCGVMLGLPMDWDTGAEHGPVTLSTGLCVADRHEGGHLVELLLVKHGINLVEAGHAFNFHWRATVSDRPETRGTGLMHVRRIPLYAKPLRCATAARFGNLPWWKGMGLHWLAWRHPSRQAPSSGPVYAPFRPQRRPRMHRLSDGTAAAERCPAALFPRPVQSALHLS